MTPCQDTGGIHLPRLLGRFGSPKNLGPWRPSTKKLIRGRTMHDVKIWENTLENKWAGQAWTNLSTSHYHVTFRTFRLQKLIGFEKIHHCSHIHLEIPPNAHFAKNGFTKNPSKNVYECIQFIFKYIYMYVCMYECMYVCIYACMYIGIWYCKT